MSNSVRVLVLQVEGSDSTIQAALDAAVATLKNNSEARQGVNVLPAAAEPMPALPAPVTAAVVESAPAAPARRGGHPRKEVEVAAAAPVQAAAADAPRKTMADQLRALLAGGAKTMEALMAATGKRRDQIYGVLWALTKQHEVVFDEDRAVYRLAK